MKPSIIENQRSSQMEYAGTAGNRYHRMFYFAMQIAVTIMKPERKRKAMLEKDPSNYTLLTYLWIFLLASWGGLVSFIAKVKAGAARCFNFSELIGELVTAAFTGMLTFWFCELANMKPLLTAAFVGISGHMGSRLIFQFEKMLEKRYGFPSQDTPIQHQEQTSKDNGDDK